LNPCFLRLRPARSRKAFIGEDSGRVTRHGNGWTKPDVISFVIRWPAFGNTRNRSIGQPVSAMKMEATSDHQKETDRKKAQRLADEYEKPSRTSSERLNPRQASGRAADL
jgi:hypothetical protein